MSLTLYWMHCGGCSGDTHALINAHSPDFFELLELPEIFLVGVQGTATPDRISKAAGMSLEIADRGLT